MKDIEITDANFENFFFDIRRHKPQDGQVMARFRCRAEFIDGQLKRDLVNLIVHNQHGGESAVKVMRKLACANERDSIRIPLQIAQDIAGGMTEDQVCQKAYEFDCEAFYYTDPENVPQNDKRWTVIQLFGVPKSSITSNVREKIEELGLNNWSDLSFEEDYGRQRSIGDVGTEMGTSPEEVGGGSPSPDTTEAERQLFRPPDELGSGRPNCQ